MHRALNFSAFVESDGRLGTVAHSTIRLSEPTTFRVHVGATVAWRRGRADRRQLDICGRAHLPELRADVRFSRARGRDSGPREEQRASVTLVPFGAELAIPAQSLDTAPPETSDLWVLTPEPSREPPWLERYAGNFQDRLLVIEEHVPVTATLGASIRTDALPSGRGATIEITGELIFERDVCVRLLVRDPGHPNALPSESESGEVVLISAGTRVPIARQTVSGMVGDNPWIALSVVDQCGSTLIPERALGQSVRFAS